MTGRDKIHELRLDQFHRGVLEWLAHRQGATPFYATLGDMPPEVYDVLMYMRGIDVVAEGTLSEEEAQKARAEHLLRQIAV